MLGIGIAILLFVTIGALVGSAVMENEGKLVMAGISVGGLITLIILIAGFILTVSILSFLVFY